MRKIKKNSIKLVNIHQIILTQLIIQAPTDTPIAMQTDEGEKILKQTQILFIHYSFFKFGEMNETFNLLVKICYIILIW